MNANISTSSASPRVSVVIPLYNSEQWIEGAVNCVLAQTFDDFELIVVDDGSTDNGGEVALASGDPRIRVVRQENRGLAGARNTGVRASRGAFIAFLDADDLWRPQKLARHMDLVDSDPEAGVTFSWSELIDIEGRSLGMVQKPREKVFTPAFIFCRNPIGNGSAPVLSRAVLDHIEFQHPEFGYSCWFDETFRQSEDVECWTRIALTTATGIACVPEPLTLYRISAGGLSAHTGKQLESWRRFRDKMATIDSRFVAAVGPLAQAYQLRYLARRSIYDGNAFRAVTLVVQSIVSSPRILYEEPGRTLTTAAAAFGSLIMPRFVFDRVRQFAAYCKQRSRPAWPAA